MRSLVAFGALAVLLAGCGAEPVAVDVWTDAGGRRVRVTDVTSYRGAEHCGWQDITFLRLAEDPTAADRGRVEEYVRDAHGELVDSLRTSYSDSVALPTDSVDTGWRRDGRELWRVPAKDAAYLVSLDDVTDVERWPASKRLIGCD